MWSFLNLSKSYLQMSRKQKLVSPFLKGFGGLTDIWEPESHLNHEEKHYKNNLINNVICSK